MITDVQEICCYDCRYASYYFSQLGAEFDRINCKGNKAPSLLVGCRYYKESIH